MIGEVDHDALDRADRMSRRYQQTPVVMMKAKDIAAKAAELVSGGRADTHGDLMDNFSNIARVWNGILAAAGKEPTGGQSLDALDVANLMEGLKIARRYSGAHNSDDYVDGCGYAACAGEIAARMKE
jgi:hypothetical protein